MAQFNTQGKVIERSSTIHHSNGEDITINSGLPVQLSGVNVTEPVTLINNLAIRDTVVNYSAPQKSNGLPFKTIRVANTLDQAIEIIFEVSRDGGTTWSYGAQLSASQASAQTVVYGRTAVVLTAPWPDWRLRVKALVAPTSGNVDVFGIQHAN